MPSNALRGGGDAGPWIGGLLRHAWQRVRERIYVGVRQAGYTDLSRAHVGMFRYETLDGQRPTQIAEQMNVTKQSVNDLLRDLERLGYIELQLDPQDNRGRLVRLTSKGRGLDAAVRREARAVERDLADTLGAGRFKALREALLTLSAQAGERSKGRITTTRPSLIRTRRSTRVRKRPSM